MGILKIKNLIHDYIDEEEDSKFRAIDNVSFDVEAGQFITILGHNGSGKSSLAKHINALLMPTEGSVWIDGIETTNEERVWTSDRQQEWYSKILTTRLWRLWLKRMWLLDLKTYRCLLLKYGKELKELLEV